MLMRSLLPLLGATALLVGLCQVAAAECFPMATLKVSFHVVFPEARQVTMNGDAARAYIDAYNNFGPRTEFAGDTLFMNIMPNGTTMVVLLVDGKGCQRMIVGPRLHRLIMAKVVRGSV